MNDRQQYPISDLALERFLLGELPDAETQQISDRVETDDVLRRRLEDLRASNRQILEEAPPAQVATEIRNRLETDVPRRTISRWVPALAVAATLLLFVPNLLRSPNEPGYIGIKGQTPHLVLYRQVDERAQRLDDGETAVEGDLIQIVYVSPDSGYGVIFSVDGRDSLVLHRAERGISFKLETGRPDTLGFSYQLDDAPEYEKFFLVTSDRPFHVAPLLKRVREAPRAFEPSEAFRLDTFTLKKE